MRHVPREMANGVMLSSKQDQSRVGARPPALVLGLGIAGLGVLRSLARLGVEVHGIYTGVMVPPGHHSRSLHARYRLHAISSDDAIIASLRRIRRHVSPNERMPLFPTTDGWAIFVSTWRHELEPDFILRTPPPAVGTTFLDKRASVSACLERGMPIPRSCVPKRLLDVERAAVRLHYPLILKPALQEDPRFPGKNAIATGAGELIEFYREHPDLVLHSMFQEIVPSGDGHILGVNTYSGEDGRVRAWTSHRRLRQWLPDRGATCYGVSETFPALREQTVRFLDELGYVGFAGVEFAEDTRTGRCFFLELNARPVLPNQLFADAGVDLTAIAYLEMCGEPVPGDLLQRDGVYWMDLHRDLPCSFVKWRRGELGIRDWARSLRHITSDPALDLRDPKPFVATLAELASAVFGRTSGRQRHTLGSVSDLLTRGTRG